MWKQYERGGGEPSAGPAGRSRVAGGPPVCGRPSGSSGVRCRSRSGVASVWIDNIAGTLSCGFIADGYFTFYHHVFISSSTFFSSFTASWRGEVPVYQPRTAPGVKYPGWARTGGARDISTGEFRRMWRAWLGESPRG